MIPLACNGNDRVSPRKWLRAATVPVSLSSIARKTDMSGPTFISKADPVPCP